MKAILDIAAPKTPKKLRSFLGMVNLYSDMWKHRSHLQVPLTPLTKLKRNAKSTWLSFHQKDFDNIKEVMAQDVLLEYPDFNLPFDIHTDASDFQLGAVISQNGKPIVFYSHRLSISQRNYMTTERELLSIHKTLRKYRNILLGHKINVFTDHQNLIFENKSSRRVQRWRMLMEEFEPTIHYIKGDTNIVADCISLLEKIPALSA